MSFSQKRNKVSNIDRLTKAAETMNGNNNFDSDAEEFWKLTLDKSGNGMAVLRFLPVSPKDEHNPDALEWVKYWDHGFQGPTGIWYIEKSLTSIGQQDAISTFNSELWNSGIEANKEQVRKQKRRLHYVSNVYVVKDPANPENEGKVFKFKYGSKIFDRIKLALKPQFEGEEAFDPFDLFTGANFKLKARKVDGQVNYDLSEWAAQSALSDDDELLDKIGNATYSLLEIVDPKNFKTAAELETRLKRVLGIDQPKSKFKNAEESNKARLDDELPFEEVKPAKVVQSKVIDDDEEDSDLAYFESLISD